MKGYDHYIAVYRTEVLTSGAHVLVLDPVKVEVFREARIYQVSEHMPTIVPGVKDREFCIPNREPLILAPDLQHIVLTTRTREGRLQGQGSCEAALDEAIAVLSAVSSAALFRTQIFRGWLQGPLTPGYEVLFGVVDPIVWDERKVEDGYRVAKAAIARTPSLKERFALMARFVAKGLAETPGEEAYVWLWTALEIFPMAGTSDIKPISAFLSSYLMLDPGEVKKRLRIGWLYSLRCKLVHDGCLPMGETYKLSALVDLERIVRAVIRHAAGMPYDGELDYLLRQTTQQKGA